MNRKNEKPKYVFEMKRNGLPYRWIVKFKVKKQLVYLGCFKSQEAAVEAYEKYRIKHL